MEGLLAGCRAALLLLTLHSSVPAATVHVSPSGDDALDGLSPAKAVRTVARAIQLAGPALDSGSVTVQFLPGSYGAQVIEITKFPKAAFRLVLEGGTSTDARAEFDGGHGGSTWLLVRGQRGARTNLTVRGFVVRNFRGAIQFFGDRFDPEQWSGGNVIELNRFENIGQQTTKVKPSLAAISLINSSDNRVERNAFVNISNIDDCAGLHAIYMAGGASNNAIVDNVFEGGCGDTIKVRDRSNFNRIERNVFNGQQGLSLLVDSFCDARRQPECRRDKQECPSWGNAFRDNSVDRDSRSRLKAIHRQVGQDHVPGCPQPPAGASSRRILSDD